MKLIVAFALVAGLYCAQAETAKNISISRSSNGGVYAPGDLMFQDEFDYLNTNVWRHEVNMNGGYNNEFQIYDKFVDNAYVRGGVLYIKPSLTVDRFGGNYEQLYNGYLKLDGCTDPPGQACERQGAYPNILPPAYSARLRTLGTFSFRYGKAQIRAKIPSGDWTWPAIWMMPENSVYGQWPRSGEIDIMESRGNRNLYNPGGVHIGSQQTASTLHFGPNPSQNSWWTAHGERNQNPGYDADFHVYELEWTPWYLKFSVDGIELKTVDPGNNGGMFEYGQFPAGTENPWAGAENYRMAPFDQNFHFILNVAVGGDYFPRDSSPAPVWGGTPFLDFMNAQGSWLPTWNGEDHAMKVDYVRVYAV